MPPKSHPPPTSWGKSRSPSPQDAKAKEKAAAVGNRPNRKGRRPCDVVGELRRATIGPGREDADYPASRNVMRQPSRRPPRSDAKRLSPKPQVRKLPLPLPLPLPGAATATAVGYDLLRAEGARAAPYHPTGGGRACKGNHENRRGEAPARTAGTSRRRRSGKQKWTRGVAPGARPARPRHRIRRTGEPPGPARVAPCLTAKPDGRGCCVRTGEERGLSHGGEP